MAALLAYEAIHAPLPPLMSTQGGKGLMVPFYEGRVGPASGLAPRAAALLLGVHCGRILASGVSAHYSEDDPDALAALQASTAPLRFACFVAGSAIAQTSCALSHDVDAHIAAAIADGHHQHDPIQAPRRTRAVELPGPAALSRLGAEAAWFSRSDSGAPWMGADVRDSLSAHPAPYHGASGSSSSRLSASSSHSPQLSSRSLSLLAFPPHKTATVDASHPALPHAASVHHRGVSNPALSAVSTDAMCLSAESLLREGSAGSVCAGSPGRDGWTPAMACELLLLAAGTHGPAAGSSGPESHKRPPPGARPASSPHPIPPPPLLSPLSVQALSLVVETCVTASAASVAVGPQGDAIVLTSGVRSARSAFSAPGGRAATRSRAGSDEVIHRAPGGPADWQVVGFHRPQHQPHAAPPFVEDWHCNEQLLRAYLPVALGCALTRRDGGARGSSPDHGAPEAVADVLAASLQSRLCGAVRASGRGANPHARAVAAGVLEATQDLFRGPAAAGITAAALLEVQARLASETAAIPLLLAQTYEGGGVEGLDLAASAPDPHAFGGQSHVSEAPRLNSWVPLSVKVLVGALRALARAASDPGAPSAQRGSPGLVSIIPATLSVLQPLPAAAAAVDAEGGVWDTHCEASFDSLTASAPPGAAGSSPPAAPAAAAWEEAWEAPLQEFPALVPLLAAAGVPGERPLLKALLAGDEAASALLSALSACVADGGRRGSDVHVTGSASHRADADPSGGWPALEPLLECVRLTLDIVHAAATPRRGGGRHTASGDPSPFAELARHILAPPPAAAATGPSGGAPAAHQPLHEIDEGEGEERDADAEPPASAGGGRGGLPSARPASSSARPQGGGSTPSAPPAAPPSSRGALRGPPPLLPPSLAVELRRTLLRGRGGGEEGGDRSARRALAAAAVAAMRAAVAALWRSHLCSAASALLLPRAGVEAPLAALRAVAAAAASPATASRQQPPQRVGSLPPAAGTLLQACLDALLATLGPFLRVAVHAAALPQLQHGRAAAAALPWWLSCGGGGAAGGSAGAAAAASAHAPNHPSLMPRRSPVEHAAAAAATRAALLLTSALPLCSTQAAAASLRPLLQQLQSEAGGAEGAPGAPGSGELRAALKALSAEVR